MAASWRKRLSARLPPLGSRVRVSVTSCRFRDGRFFSVFLSFSPAINFDPPFLHNHLIYFISSASVMLRQAWSASILPIPRSSIKGLHRISSLDPALYRQELRNKKIYIGKINPIRRRNYWGPSMRF